MDRFIDEIRRNQRRKHSKKITNPFIIIRH